MWFFQNASRHADVKATITAKADKTVSLRAEREAILAELAGMQIQPTYNFVN